MNRIELARQCAAGAWEISQRFWRSDPDEIWIKSTKAGFMKGNYDTEREHIAALAMYDARQAEIDEAVELLRLCVPSNLCLTNPNVKDDINVPFDMTIGEIRLMADFIAKHGGA